MAIIVWSILAVLFLILELSTFDFILCWFSISSIVALIFALFHLPLWLQVSVFVVVGIVLLLSLRKLCLEIQLKNRTNNLKRKILGKVGIIKKQVANNVIYIAKFDKKSYTVMLKTPCVLKVGDRVKVNEVLNGVAFASLETSTENKQKISAENKQKNSTENKQKISAENKQKNIKENKNGKK